MTYNVMMGTLNPLTDLLLRVETLLTICREVSRLGVQLSIIWAVPAIFVHHSQTQTERHNGRTANVQTAPTNEQWILARYTDRPDTGTGSSAGIDRRFVRSARATRHAFAIKHRLLNNISAFHSARLVMHGQQNRTEQNFITTSKSTYGRLPE